MTTGSFESDADAPGNIDKVQVKANDDTDNYNALENGGTLTLPLDQTLTRHQTIDVHANISLVGHGTTVVQVSEIVKLRPDLVAAGLLAAPAAIVDQPLLITASVQERNGDVGARANCVLSVDGAIAARAPFIWVDAGDEVACQFSHAFNAAGAHQIAVSLDSVAPGDYDDSNNGISATVNVYDHADQMHRWLSGSTEAEFERRRYDSRPADTRSSEQGWLNGSHFSAHLKLAEVDMSAIGIGYREASDGVVFADESSLEEISRSTSGNGTQCVSFYQHERFINAQVCSPGMPPTIPSPKPRDWVSVELHRVSSNAIYHSSAIDLQTGTYYSQDWESINGVQEHFGDTVDKTVTVWDTDQFWQADVHHVLQRSESLISKPFKCNPLGCSETYDRTITRQDTQRFNWPW
jgi:hypothetical protein